MEKINSLTKKAHSTQQFDRKKLDLSNDFRSPNVKNENNKKMKKIIFASILITTFFHGSFAQNVGVNADGTTPESGVMLDVKGTNSYSTSATQNIFQLKSADASSTALKMRLGLSTGASLYGSIDVYDATAAVNRHLILQPTTGNVGIGTTAPDTKLQVDGGDIAARATANTQQRAIIAEAFDYASLPSWKSTFIEYSDAGVAGNIFSGIPNANLGIVGFQNASNALIYTNNNIPMIFGTMNTERMRISGGGNVGIGTPSPAALVDVKGTNATAHLRITSNSGRASLVLTSDVGNTSGPIITWSKQNVGEFAMYDYNGAAKLAIVDASTGNDAFSIMGGKTTIGNGSGISGASSLNVYGNTSIGLTYYNTAAPASGVIVEGNVGIGTTNPTSKLQVVGLPVYANNAAALIGGLSVGAIYRTGADPDPVCVVH